MAYLKTLISYNQPSEAEVDKAFLESHEIPVCLLNANTSRNELGAPFYIQLQVNEEDFVRARDLLKSMNPQRFGSAERVAEIDRVVKRGVVAFFVAAIPIGLLAFFLIPVFTSKSAHVGNGIRLEDYRLFITGAAAIAAGIAGSYFFGAVRNTHGAVSGGRFGP